MREMTSAPKLLCGFGMTAPDRRVPLMSKNSASILVVPISSAARISGFSDNLSGAGRPAMISGMSTIISASPLITARQASLILYPSAGAASASSFLSDSPGGSRAPFAGTRHLPQRPFPPHGSSGVIRPASARASAIVFPGLLNFIFTRRFLSNLFLIIITYGAVVFKCFLRKDKKEPARGQTLL